MRQSPEWEIEVDRIMEAERPPGYYFQTRNSERHGAVEWTLAREDAPSRLVRFVTVSVVGADADQVARVYWAAGVDSGDWFLRIPREGEQHPVGELGLAIQEVLDEAINLAESLSASELEVSGLPRLRWSRSAPE